MIRQAVFFFTMVFLWFIPLTFISFNNYFLGNQNISLYTFIILWIINIICITLSFFKIFKDKPINNQYLFILIVNYLVSPLFHLFFFNFKDIWLSLLSLIVIFISAAILFLETKKLDRKASMWIIPYLVLNIYLIITVIYILIKIA